MENINININPCGCCKGNGAGNTPIGHVLAYMGTTAPDNYLVCDGTEYSIVDYPELSEHLQKQFESVNFFGGDGTDTFAVPDLRGEFLRGTGTAARDSGTGAEVGVHQEPTKVPHIGGNRSGVYWTPDQDGPESYMGDSERFKYSSVTPVKTVKYASTIGTTTDPKIPDQPIGYTVRTTNTAVLYCIKYA